MTSVDPLPRLAAALSDISAQLQDISDEIRTASAPSAATRPAQPGYPPPPNPVPGFAPAPPYAAAPPPPPAYYPPPPAYGPAHDYPQFPDYEPAPPRATLWERMSREGAGSKLVAWVGGAVTLAGVVLLLVLAIQRGYIGPVPRIVLGAALGLALVAIALRLHRSPDGRTGAIAVAATGAAVLYLDTVAATGYYRFVPAWAGLALGLLVAVGGVLIAWRWDAEVLAVFVVLGSAATAPFVTHDVTLLIGFLLVLQIASSPAQLQRHWTTLAPLAAAPPVLAVLLDATVAQLGRSGDRLTIAALAVATSLVQLVVSTVLARRPPGELSVCRADIWRRHTDNSGGPGAQVEAALGMVLAAPVPTLVAVLLVARWDGAALAGGLGAALVAAGAARRMLGLPSRFADAAVIAGLAALFEATCIACTGDVRALALLAGGVLLAVVAERLRHGASLAAATVFGAVGLAVALGEAARPSYLAIAPANRVAMRSAISAGTTGVVVVVTALVLCWAAGRVVTASDPAAPHARWTVAGLVALYGASVAVVSIGLAISPDRHGFLIGHMLVTLSWTVCAIVLLLRHTDSAPLRVAGLALVAAALAKLVLFDLASLSGIPRVLAFLGAGLVLLAAGARYARLSANSRP